MYRKIVSVSGLNLGNAVTEKTTLTGSLGGLGQLVLLHTDACVWGMEDDTPGDTNKLFQDLHVPKVNMQFEILADKARIPRNLIVRNTCLSDPLCHQLCGCSSTQPKHGESHSHSGILLNPGNSKVHSHEGKREGRTKGLLQEGFWCGVWRGTSAP